MYLYNKTNISIDDEGLEEIRNIINSGWVCSGKWVNSLEDYFKKHCGVKYAIACANATNGLSIAVRSAGWDRLRIAIPAFTWPSTLYALELNNCTPVWCDTASMETWIMKLPNSCLYDAVLAVDTFGLDSSRFLCTDKPIIFDAAHGISLENLGNRRSIAEVISFSFTKLVSGMQGGMILCNDKKFYEEALELVTLSSKLEEINALLTLGSIKEYANNIRSRRSIINTYKSNLRMTKNIRFMPPIVDPSVFCILFTYDFDRNEVELNLNALGVQTKQYYEPLVKGLHNTDEIYRHILALPVHEDIIPIQDEIINTIKEVCR